LRPTAIFSTGEQRRIEGGCAVNRSASEIKTTELYTVRAPCLPAKKYIKPYTGMNADKRACRTDEFSTARMIPMIGLPNIPNIMNTINQCQMDSEPISPSPKQKPILKLSAYTDPGKMLRFARRRL
jgi:hypothetical protein